MSNYYQQHDANQYGDPNRYYQQKPMQYGTTQMVVEPQVQEYVTLPRKQHSQELNHRHPFRAEDSFVGEPAYEQAVTVNRQQPQPPAPRMMDLPNSSSANLVEKEKKDEIYPKLGPQDQRRCMYGCIPVNKRSRYICIGSVSLVVLILGIVGFIFFPRFPEMRVQSINVAPGNSFSLTPVDLTKEDLDFRFELAMNMNISVRNNNMYHLKIEAIDLTAFVMANASQLNAVVPFPAETLFSRVLDTRVRITEQNRKQRIGTGNRKEPIVFPPGQEIFFQMQFLVSYSPNKEFKAVNDPALNEIIQLCVAPPILPPGQNRTTQIRYEAQTDIAALRWLPFKPGTSGDININCPFQGAARDAFISAIKGSSQSGQAVQNGQVPAAPPSGQLQPTTNRNGRNLRTGAKTGLTMHLPISPNFILAQ
jgi:hypothetical protein